MANYTNEYSKLPEQIYTLHNFLDADDTVGSLIETIKSYQAQGLYTQAKNLIEVNKDVLEPYVISTEVINAIDEEIRNLEILCKSKQQQIFYQDDTEEPGDLATYGDVWIGGA